MSEYRLMSYNIQSCKDYIYKTFDPLVASRVINQFKPDIVCLNEVRTLLDSNNVDNWFNAPYELSKLCNLPFNYFGKSIDLNYGPYGNMILSKYLIKDSKTVIIGDPKAEEKTENAYYETRSFSIAHINELTVIVTHLGLAKIEEKKGIEALVKTIKTISGPIVLLGDFNMTEDNIILNPLRDILINSSHYLKKDSKSFPSVNPTIKIDYIFCSKDIIIKNAFIPQVVGSDHLPYVIDIEIQRDCIQ